MSHTLPGMVMEAENIEVTDTCTCREWTDHGMRLVSHGHSSLKGLFFALLMVSVSVALWARLTKIHTILWLKAFASFWSDYLLYVLNGQLILRCPLVLACPPRKLSSWPVLCQDFLRVLQCRSDHVDIFGCSVQSPERNRPTHPPATCCQRALHFYT